MVLRPVPDPPVVTCDGAALFGIDANCHEPLSQGGLPLRAIWHNGDIAIRGGRLERVHDKCKYANITYSTAGNSNVPFASQCPPTSDRDAQPGATNMMVTASEIAAKIEDAIKVDPASSLLTP